MKLSNRLKTKKYVHSVRTNHLYKVWLGMKIRCANKKRKDYRYYGQRGISLSKRWEVFENFVDDMLPSFQKGLTIDRIDNNKGYSNNNCRWVSHKKNCNNRGNCHFIIDPKDGEKYTIQELADKYKITRMRISNRIRMGIKNFDELVTFQDLRKYRKLI